MIARTKLICAAAIGFVSLFNAGPAYAGQITNTLIRNVRIFDGENVIPRGSVLIVGEKISAVGLDLIAPRGAKIVDGTGKTLLPGLINGHVHMVGSFPTTGAGPFEDAAGWGVTTVIDMAGENLAMAKRELHSGRHPAAADVIGAGNAATVPHGQAYHEGAPTLTKPEEAQDFVDARIKEGSDFIKIFSDTEQEHGRNIPVLSDETLKAVVDAAHRRGLIAVVHALQPMRERRAILAGADALVHMGAYDEPDADYGQLLRSHHAFQDTNLITWSPPEYTQALAKEPDFAPYFPAWALKQFSEKKGFADAVYPYSVAHFKQVVAEKVPFVAGTDGSAQYLLHVELAIIVKDGGVTPIEALKAATSNPARLFPHLQDRGRIAPGLRADLLLVNGDPTTNILDTRKINTVWVQGYMVDRDAFRKKMLAAHQPAGRRGNAP